MISIFWNSEMVEKLGNISAQITMWVAFFVWKFLVQAEDG